MAVTPFTKDDFRTLDEVKKGVVNGVFKTPEEILPYLEKLFGDAKMTLHKEPTNNSFMVELVSFDYIADKYNRAFRFHYTKHDEEYNKIINIEEIKE